MTLFKFFNNQTENSWYSNIIEFYDFLPKYIWKNKKDKKNIEESEITRETNIRGVNFLIKITPAIIQSLRTKKIVLSYPGPREEILEDVLRKLSITGNGCFINGRAGVVFTLYELQKELIKTGHEYNLNQIKESIKICRYASFNCMNSDNKSFISSNYFPLIGTNQFLSLKKSRQKRWFVQFNSLIHKFITETPFKKKFNYKLGMQIRSPLARYIYKKICYHLLKNPYPYSPFICSLIRFLKYSPRDISIEISENIRAMQNALKILKEKEIIFRFIPKFKKLKRKILDVSYLIILNPKFTKKTIF